MEVLAPVPPPAVVAPAFYHGTSVSSRGESILRDGHLRAATREELDARYGKSFQRPVDGRVYLTTSLEYATVYALGGYVMGCDCSRKQDAANPDGYIFAVEAAGAPMLPDEDSLGAIPSILHDFDFAPAPCAGSDRAAFIHYCLLYPEFRASLDRQVRRILTPHMLRKAQEGMAVWESKAGKALLRGFTHETLARLTPLFPHRSAPGPLRVLAAWKLPKADAKSVRRDCSNLFELATRVV